MLAPRPPLSVARRRAVAEMIVAQKQQAVTIEPGHVLVISMPVPAQPLPTIPAAPPDMSPNDDDTPI